MSAAVSRATTDLFPLAHVFGVGIHPSMLPEGQAPLQEALRALSTYLPLMSWPAG